MKYPWNSLLHVHCFYYKTWFNVLFFLLLYLSWVYLMSDPLSRLDSLWHKNDKVVITNKKNLCYVLEWNSLALFNTIMIDILVRFSSVYIRKILVDKKKFNRRYFLPFFLMMLNIYSTSFQLNYTHANHILESIQMPFCFSIKVQKSIKIRTLHFIGNSKALSYKKSISCTIWCIIHRLFKCIRLFQKVFSMSWRKKKHENQLHTDIFIIIISCIQSWKLRKKLCIIEYPFKWKVYAFARIISIQTFFPLQLSCFISIIDF